MADRPTTRRRLFPPVYSLLALVLMAALHRLVPVREIIPWPARLFGIAFVLGGILLILWAARLFEAAGTTMKPFEQSAALVVRGPYRFTRNPIYLGMACALTGVAVLLGSLSPWIVIPVFIILIERLFIRREEADLEGRFGPGYEAFKVRVRRWL